MIVSWGMRLRQRTIYNLFNIDRAAARVFRFQHSRNCILHSFTNHDRSNNAQNMSRNPEILGDLMTLISSFFATRHSGYIFGYQPRRSFVINDTHYRHSFFIEYTEPAPMRGQHNNTYTEEHSLGQQNQQPKEGQADYYLGQTTFLTDLMIMIPNCIATVCFTIFIWDGKEYWEVRGSGHGLERGEINPSALRGVSRHGKLLGNDIGQY